MKNSQKAQGIVLGCMLAVGVISAVIIWKNFRPSPGKPYEQVTLEQAMTFMDYETDFILVDIGSEDAFSEEHLDGAVNLPYEELGSRVSVVLPDKNQQIYVYGRDPKQSEMAARKLCTLGYTNIMEISDVRVHIGAVQETTETSKQF